MTPIHIVIFVVLAIIWISPWKERVSPESYCNFKNCYSNAVGGIRSGFQWRWKIIATLVLAGLVQVVRIFVAH